MENAFSFMPNYLQMASFFIHGKTFNKQESMIFLAVCKSSTLCVYFHVGTFRVHLYFWPNLNFPLEYLMKVVLTCTRLINLY